MAITRIGNPAIADQRGVNFRNIIINGSMDIAQRGTSASSISSSSTYNTCDRWLISVSSLGTWTNTQSTDVPSGQGFSKSFKIDCTTADASPSSGAYCMVQQRIEGQNLQYLKKGTSNAEQVTLSFWVKSNKTGTYVAQLEDTDNNRSTSKSYTINSADTWEKKTITYDADTTGAFNNDNGLSLVIEFWLGAGSTYTSGTLATSWESQTSANRAVGQVNLADNTSNEWYITGVQLETGQVASDFEFLPVDVNLQRCLRYYQLLARGTQIGLAPATYYTSASIYGNFTTKVPMRATPTLDIVTGTNYYIAYRNSGGDTLDTFTLAKGNNLSFELTNTTQASGTAGQSAFIRTNNASADIAITAEL